MKPVFVDTFYWVAVTDPNDARHLDAVQFGRSSQFPYLVTTDEVLDEYLAYFAGARNDLRHRAGQFVLRLLRNPAVRVHEQSRSSFVSGLGLYLARPDKGYSLTDCISMETMRREGISEVLTNDRHFEQEGFRALFR